MNEMTLPSRHRIRPRSSMLSFGHGGCPQCWIGIDFALRIEYISFGDVLECLIYSHPWIYPRTIFCQMPAVGTPEKIKWNESGFRPPLCTYRLIRARITYWGWWDEWDDTALQTQDSTEAEHATSRSRKQPTMLNQDRLRAKDWIHKFWGFAKMPDIFSPLDISSYHILSNAISSGDLLKCLIYSRP